MSSGVAEYPATQGKGGCRPGDESGAQANSVRANGGAVRPELSRMKDIALLRRPKHFGEKTRGMEEALEPRAVPRAERTTK